MATRPSLPPEPAINQKEWSRDHMGYQNAVWHAPLIAGIVQTYPEPVYIEIGVLRCECFNVVAPLTREAHAVDPLRPEVYGGQLGERGHFWQMDSSVFFELYDGTPPDVIFVDGEHVGEIPPQDTMAAFDLIAPGGVVIMHDTWIGDLANECLSGQVWEIRRQLEADPEIECFTFPRFPGITIARLL